jgi:hypothetical protein
MDKCTNETLAMPGAVKMERCLCNNKNNITEGCNAPPQKQEKIYFPMRQVKEIKTG